MQSEVGVGNKLSSTKGEEGKADQGVIGIMEVPQVVGRGQQVRMTNLGYASRNGGSLKNEKASPERGKEDGISNNAKRVFRQAVEPVQGGNPLRVAA